MHPTNKWYNELLDILPELTAEDEARVSTFLVDKFEEAYAMGVSNTQLALSQDGKTRTEPRNPAEGEFCVEYAYNDDFTGMAIQYTGDNDDAIAAFLGGCCRGIRKFDASIDIKYHCDDEEELVISVPFGSYIVVSNYYADVGPLVYDVAGFALSWRNLYGKERS